MKILTWKVCNHPELDILMMVDTEIARLKETTMNCHGKGTPSQHYHLCKTLAQVCIKRSFATQTSHVPTITFWQTNLKLQNVWSTTIVS